MQLAGTLRLKDIDKGFRTLRNASTVLTAESAAGKNPRCEIGISDGFGAAVIKYALVHEFGSDDGNIPQRSYIRSTIDENRPKYAVLIKGIIVAGQAAMMSAARSNQNARAAWDNVVRRGLEQIGRMVTADIRAKIDSNIPPALQPATIARKQAAGNPKPTIALVAKGLLRRSVAHQVTSTPRPKGGGHG